MLSTNSLYSGTVPRQQNLFSNAAAAIYSQMPRIVMAFMVWLGCLHGLNAAGIFDMDEGLYATAARQMVDSGNWLVPHVGSHVFFDKPPLAYWLQAISIRFLGATPHAARLPSALAAALTALALWWWAKRRGVERIGLLAAMIYAVCPLTVVIARQVSMDSLLAFWVTLAVIGWLEAEAGNAQGYLLMATAVGLAMMTKGIVGIFLPVATLLIWRFMRRHVSQEAYPKAPWLAMSGLFLLVVLPWHLLMWRANGSLFFREYIVHQHVQRFLGEDFAHNLPIWFYIPMLTIGMFPWSTFIPLAWWRGWQGRQDERQGLEAAWAMWALWALVVVIFFSSSKSKLPGYMQPAVPALALLVAARLEALWQARHKLATGEIAAFAFISILLGALLTTVGALGWQWSSLPGAAMLHGKAISLSATADIKIMAPCALALGGLFLLGTLMTLACRKAMSQVVGLLLLMNLLLIAFTIHLGLPAWSNYNITPLHDLGRQALPALERGEPLVIYALRPGRTSLRFVLGHTEQITQTGHPEVLQQVMQKAGHGYILTQLNTPLPPLSGSVRPQATAGRWILWRCQ